MKNITRIPNPLAKAGWGAFTYIDRSLKQPPLDTKFILSVSINNSCNLECPHCVEKGFKRNADNYKLLVERLSETENPIIWFSIAGKEPTTTPERLEEISKLGKEKSEEVILMTNGLDLTSELQDRIHPYIDYIDISIDGINSYKSPQKSIWNNINYASKNGFKKISVLTTLIGGDQNNHKNIEELIEKISQDFEGRVDHSIGFYLGWPEDKLLLTKEEVLKSIEQIINKDHKTTIQIPLAYSRFLPAIFKEFGLKLGEVRFDSKTGIPSYDINGHNLIPGSHLKTPLYGLRAEVDGNVYFGCSHLMIDGDSSKYKIGDLKQKTFSNILDEISQGKNNLINNISRIDKRCIESPCFDYCRGGDRLGGLIYMGEPRDSFCQEYGLCKE